MSTNDLPAVTIYTDGACNPNPGPGGWAAIILSPENKVVELSGHEDETTSNRMELTAAIEALKSLPQPSNIKLYTDSKYLKKGITEWLPRWEKTNWRTQSKTAVKNQDLWQELNSLLQRHQVKWEWTKGHAGNKWNERADHLATSEIAKSRLPLDDDNAVHIFTAASYLGREKKGGWGVVLRYRENIKELSGGEKDTSGNRMHIRSAIEGLKAIKKRTPIHIYTTSSYLRDGASTWIKKWQARDWITKDRTPVSNRELWEELAILLDKWQPHWHVVSKENMPDEMSRAKALATGAAYGSS